MNIIKYLNKQGYDTVDASFYNLIDIWKSWYQADVRAFHRYSIYNGKKTIKCKRLSLGMGKKLSEDIADLLLNEKTQITINNEPTDTFVKQVLKDNNFDVLGSDYQERKAYTGTVAYVPYLDDIETDVEGNVVGGGKIKINYVTAPNIYPLSWSNGDISECAFTFLKTISGKKYAHLQIHKLEKGQYVIENHVVECTDGAENEVLPDQWKYIKGFETLTDKVYTGSPDRQFVIDRLNIANNSDSDNPMGISIFANSLDILQGIDTVYDSYINEFVLGKRRIFVAPEMTQELITGHPTFDPDDVVFYQLPPETLDKGGKPIYSVEMDIRAEEHEKALNDNLNMLSMKCGFGQNHYKFENGSLQTATQVISENSDMFRMINKHELVLESVLDDLIQIIIRLGSVMGLKEIQPESEITVTFDDSIIEDKTAERNSDRQDVSMGAMTLAEYRSKWYGETEEEAAKNIVDETPDPDPQEE